MATSLTTLLSPRRRALALAVAATALAVVFARGAASSDAAPAEPNPAPRVDVASVQPQELREWHQYSGRLAPVESAAIRPLVGGTITQVLFEEGQHVQVGDPLFVIDTRPFLIAESRAQAALATAQSQQGLAEDEFARARELHNKGLASDSVFDTARNALRVAEAAVLQAQSNLEQAQLNLDYANIKAPISGRIGRAELTTGNVVEAGPNAPVLTRIVAEDKLYAEFNVDEQSYIRLAQGAQRQQRMPVELALAQEDGTVYRGHLVAFDNSLDSSSGTIRARALIDNSDGVLTSGLYAQVKMGSEQARSVLLIPERAIGTNQSHKFVYVVGDGDLVEYREVTLGAVVNGQRVVQQGLTPGDRVVVNGLSRIAPNMQVDAQEVSTTELLVSR